MRGRRWMAAGCAGLMLGAGGQAISAETPRAGVPAGYLAQSDLPDGLVLLPPPPAAGSPAAAADEAYFRDTRTLQGGPRWSQALADNAILEPGAFRSWSCAAGVALSNEGTPVTVRLLTRIAVDAGLGTYPAKAHYDRPRPFMVTELPTCTNPEPLRGNGSYPSGHSAVGWAWALVLAQLRPDRATEILTRGREFGDSRAICGVHYMTDVESGRTFGAGVVARLQASPEFQQDLTRARMELAGLETIAPAACLGG